MDQYVDYEKEIRKPEKERLCNWRMSKKMLCGTNDAASNGKSGREGYWPYPR